MQMKKTFLMLIKIMKHTLRIAVALAMVVIVWSCTQVPNLKEESTGTFIRIPFVRVLLNDNQNEYIVDADKTYAIECLAAGKQTVYYTSNPVKIKLSGRNLKVLNHKNQLIQSKLDEVNIIPRGNKNRLQLDETYYRGMIKYLPNGEAVSEINIVYMEDYLKGVVPPEIGKREENEIESVKAQAIAARTYAMSHLQQYANKPYDMKSSIFDQVYKGFSIEDELINRAIEETAGEVLFYNDEYINAYYHSTCGGMTDDIGSVWERQEIPYLKAVRDSNACEWSKYFNWSETFTEKQLRGRIEQYLASDRGRDMRIGRLKDIKIISTSPGGRIGELKIITEYDNFKFKKDRIRWVIGRTSSPDLILPSSRFEIELTKDNKGLIKSVVFTGSGYGHGIGMCQCGAIGLSRQGWPYMNILKHYYTGIELKKLY